MSSILYNNISIYEAINKIDSGEFIMPVFQRQYVWNMAQIEKLWDSLLLGYPIANFLFWDINSENTAQNTLFCNFLKEITFNSSKNADPVNYDLENIKLHTPKTAILDGQQRLTSLYLSLKGVFYKRGKHARIQNNNKELIKLIIELDRCKAFENDEYNTKKYGIQFKNKVKLLSNEFEIKRIFSENFKNKNTRNSAIDEILLNIPFETRDYAGEILEKLCSKIYDEKLISYTELTQINHENALEMFVRYNSGGKALKKSDIKTSILGAYWPNSKVKLNEVLGKTLFKIDSEFILKAAILLYGDKMQSNINQKIADGLRENWEYFKTVLKNLEEVLNILHIDLDYINGKNVLLPIFYSIYYRPNDYKENLSDFQVFIARAVLFRYFSAGTSLKLDKLVNAMKQENNKLTLDVIDYISELRVSEDKLKELLETEYGTRAADDILYFLSKDWIIKDSRYEASPIFDLKLFENTLFVKSELWQIYKKQLFNLYFEEKKDTNFSERICNQMRDYNGNMTQEEQKIFREKNFIPDVSMQLNNFEQFYNARKEIMTDKIKNILGI